MKLKKKVIRLQRLVDRLLWAVYVSLVMATLGAFVFVSEFTHWWLG